MKTPMNTVFHRSNWFLEKQCSLQPVQYIPLHSNRGYLVNVSNWNRGNRRALILTHSQLKGARPKKNKIKNRTSLGPSGWAGPWARAHKTHWLIRPCCYRVESCRVESSRVELHVRWKSGIRFLRKVTEILYVSYKCCIHLWPLNHFAFKYINVSVFRLNAYCF